MPLMHRETDSIAFPVIVVFVQGSSKTWTLLALLALLTPSSGVHFV